MCKVGRGLWMEEEEEEEEEEEQQQQERDRDRGLRTTAFDELRMRSAFLKSQRAAFERGSR